MQNNNLGILLKHYGSSQAAYFAILNANKMIDKNVEITLFYENLSSPCIKPKCSVLCLNELYSYNGIVITTTIDNTIAVSKYPGNKFLIYYVWDLEWLRDKKDFIYNIQAFRKANMILSRSETHARMIKNYCNIKPKVIDDFNLEKVLEYVN